jgi:predicted ATPase
MLYFLGLLALLYQEPALRILLIEEPETGIHPRRIHEVLAFIRKIAEEKGVQVIMTTHSPLVLDEFAQDTDAIFVFDTHEGETKVRSMEQIMEDRNQRIRRQGGEEIDYAAQLGENWTLGLLNGIPHEAGIPQPRTATPWAFR